MSGFSYFDGKDINDPAHRAEPAELFMGLAAALSALFAATVLLEFRPKRRSARDA